MSLTLTEAQALTALRSFLTAILPTDVVVIRGQANRTPEPKAVNFVVITPLFRERLATNVDNYIDAVFTGSIAGNVLTITAVGYGSLVIGSQILGVNVAANTLVLAIKTGSGGIGTYTLNNTQTVNSQKLAAGVITLLQAVKMTVQMDIHGPASADNTHLITTLFRDAVGVVLFKSSGFEVAPLYADNPKQIPFINGELQVENRWTMDAVMQCNPLITLSQDFADQLSILLQPVPIP